MNNQQAFSIEAISDFLHRILSEASESGLIPDTDGKPRSHGYFCIRRSDGGRVLHLMQIGEVPNLKVSKYMEFALEKGIRVWDLNSRSSWETRNPEKSRWAGAIRAGQYIISFSGLPELFDEALMLLLGVHMLWISIDEARRIAAISNNTHFNSLLPFMGYRPYEPSRSAA